MVAPPASGDRNRLGDRRVLGDRAARADQRDDGRPVVTAKIAMTMSRPEAPAV